MASRTVVFAGAIGALVVLVAQTPTPPDAKASDPVALQWMVGTPPPRDKQIRFEDGSFAQFPQLRWSQSHWRELFPTAAIRRDGAVAALPRAERKDIDQIAFTPIGKTEKMTWAQSLDANYTDGIVVLHKGRIVYEKYLGALSAEREHIAFSVTKSFFGTMAGVLIAEGKLNAKAPVTEYIPELKPSGFGDATVQQVLDMTTALNFSEVYTDANADIWKYSMAAGFRPKPAGYSGPKSISEYLVTVPKQGVHGEGFTYRSVNTDVVAWLIARVTGKPAHEALRERIWSKLGAEADASIAVDSLGAPFAAGGLNLRTRDLARFGEMIRLKGRWNGQQVIPASVVEEIARGGDPQKFPKASYPTLPGWSYHNQWWVSHNEHGVFMGRGIHGQAVYVDPKAEMVIARFASHPVQGNVGIDPTSLPAYEALAKHLISK
jgi:CubicO group peptidase (beta-lactamase class C family)